MIIIFLLSSVTSKLVSTTFTTFYHKISLIKHGYISVRRWSSTCFHVSERLLLLPQLHSDRFITFISSDLGINITGCGRCCNSNAKSDKLWIIDGKMLMIIFRRKYMNSKDSIPCSCCRILPHSSISTLPDYLWAHPLKHNT